MNEVICAIKKRRSIRRFTDQRVPHELLQQIAEAGLYAPSSMGRQVGRLLVIEDEEVIAALSSLNAAVMGSEGDPFYGAKALIVVLADKTDQKGVEDGSLMMQNMMLAAHSLGLGSCWVHRAKEVMESDYGRELLRRYLPEGEYNGIANLILGYPAQESEAADRREGRIVYL